MSYSIKKQVVNQIISIKRNFAQSGSFPLEDILSAEELKKAVQEEVSSKCRNRIFSPIKTLEVFLSQVLSTDHSCIDAVARVLASRATSCSSSSSSYCTARKRLSQRLVGRLVLSVGNKLHKKSLKAWSWKGRSVKLVDGTTVSMPDTIENQKEYPQIKEQKPGLGFPIARIVAIISLNCGSLLDFEIGPYAGKGTSEQALLRKMLKNIDPYDVLIADRYYCSYWLIAELIQKKLILSFKYMERARVILHKERI